MTGAQYVYRRASGIYFVRLCVSARLKQYGIWTPRRSRQALGLEVVLLVQGAHAWSIHSGWFCRSQRCVCASSLPASSMQEASVAADTGSPS